MDFDRATSYAKKKESIRSFKPFLLHFLAIHHISHCDTAGYLPITCFKDKNGKTQIHWDGCKYIGQARRSTCGCPRRLSLFQVRMFKVVGSLQSKQNAALTEPQQGYLFQTKVVNSTQDFSTSTHTRLANYTSTINTAIAKYPHDLCHTLTNTVFGELYTRPSSHFNKHYVRKHY